MIASIPNCSPAEPMRRTLGALICLLILKFNATLYLNFLLRQLLWSESTECSRKDNPIFYPF
ncbi:hypothetical protein CpB1027 [Chlamydia pneumoniae TW-183]|uniref:Uncharacterized protein n=1 Tax=Chlamydia pneumoniae TaxID=83558 RepID=A0ABN3YRF3_CHLPN|nr:hypothetical protein CpB1027 [Chlamydia pneumoniae TW-183]